MRGVAAEAGWSTGALNHYFADKEELLLLAFHEVAGRSSARLTAADSLREAVAALLPLDAERRAEVRVWFALLGLALTRPGLARAQRDAYRDCRAFMAGALREAQERGELAPGLDPDCEAIELVAFADGISVQATLRSARVRARAPAPDTRRAPGRATFEAVTVEPLRFEDGALLVLDQRALPAEERWIRCERPEQVADCIRTLAVRGAPAIGIAAAYGLALAEDRAAAAELLRSTRPTAVNLAWALEQGLAAPDPLARARELHAEQQAADRRLAALGAERFAPGDRALTHCNAGALATGGLRHRRRRAAGGLGVGAAGLGLGGRDAPAAPGRAAHRLRAGARRDPVLRGDRLERGHADGARAGGPVVVGADRIAANGDVANKIGTYPLAVLAARHEIPFYVAAPVSTLDRATASGAAIPIEERDPSELSASMPAVNFAFDVTPAELVSAIFTEAGVLEPPYEEVDRRCRRALRWWPPRARCCASGWWPARRAT